MTHLNLSHNRIADRGAEALSRMLDGNTSLRELDLSWNNIGWKGGVAIAKALGNPKSELVSLDASWNTLGSIMDRGGTCAKLLAEALEVNTKLQHASLSHNNFTKANCETISMGLRANHTLMGLHMAGDATIDARGFMESLETGAQDWQETTGGHSHVFTRILRPKIHGQEGWTPCSNCWICERWVECRFVWNRIESKPDDSIIADKPTEVVCCGIRAA